VLSGVGATAKVKSSQLAQYFGSPVAPELLYSDIKLVSLFSKKVLVDPLILCTDLKIKQSAGNETYLTSCKCRSRILS